MLDRGCARIARCIADRLLDVQNGPVDAPETWTAATERLQHDVRLWNEPGGCAGYYDSAEAGTGVIWINAAHSPPVQARALVHEIAHAEMNVLASGLYRGEIPGYFAGEWERQGYDDDPGDVRHQVARLVEEIVFGKPR